MALAFSIRLTERACSFSGAETGSAAADLDLISLLKAIPYARMRRGFEFPPGTCCSWPGWGS